MLRDPDRIVDDPVGLNGDHLPRGRNVPDDRGAVVAAGQQAPAIAIERARPHARAVPREGRDEGSRRQVPDPSHAVVAAHHDARAARTAEAAVLYHANQLDSIAATRPVE